MEQQLLGMALVVAVTIALCIIMRRQDSSAGRDRARISERYRLKGVEVEAMKFLGYDPPFPTRRRGVRKYGVSLKLADGARETRILGIEEAPLAEPKLWRYDDAGRRQPMF